jgi:hypothetical protein
MPKRTVPVNQVFVVLAGLIAVLLGAGMANADVRGALVVTIDQLEARAAEMEAEAAAEDENSEGLQVQAPVQLAADPVAPAAPEEEAKVEDEPEEVEEEVVEPAGDPPADDDDTAAAAAPAVQPPDDDTDDTNDDTDKGKTSIPLPGGGDDTTDDGADTADAEDAEDADTDGDDTGGDD